MDKKYLLMKVCVGCFLIFGMQTLKAQESVNTSGGDIQGADGNISFSLGQVFVSASESESASVIEGIQQPYEISVLTSIKKAEAIELNVKAYPNPTTDILQLEVDLKSFKDLNYQILDTRGEVMASDKILNANTSLALSTYASGTYLIRIFRKNRTYKTFKIIKQ